MRFSILALSALCSCGYGATLAPRPRAVAIGPGNGISIQDYIDCLYNEVKDWGWSTNNCERQGRVSFWRRGRAWSDPRDCYSSCLDEIATAIRQGFPERECSHTAGAAQCWMGYNTRQ